MEKPNPIKKPKASFCELFTCKSTSSLLSTFFFKAGLSGLMPIPTFIIYFMSYLKKTNPSLTQQQGYFFVPILNFFGISTYPLSGILDNKIGSQRSLILGIMVMSVAAVWLCLTTKILSYYFIFPLYGIGLGLCQLIAVRNVCSHFKGYEGLISGIVAAFSNLMSVACNLVGEYVIINPEMTKQDKNGFYPYDVGKSVINYMYIQETMMVICTLLSLLFIVPPKEHKQLSSNTPPEEALTSIENISSLGIEESNKENKEEKMIPLSEDVASPDKLENNETTSRRSIRKYSYKDIKKGIFSKQAKRTALVFCLNYFVPGSMMISYRNVGKDISPDIIQLIGTIGFVIGILIVPVWGFLIDKFAFRVVVSVFNVISTIVGVSFSFVLKNDYLFLIDMCFAYALIHGNQMMINPHVMKVFGIKYSLEIGGVISIARGASGLLQSVFMYFMTNSFENSKYGYLAMFGFGGCLSIASLIIGLFETDEEFVY